MENRGTARSLRLRPQDLTLCLFYRDISKVADENQLTINYGKTGLGEMPKALVILTNKTAIATKFNVAVEYFCAARTPTPPTGKLTSLFDYMSST